MQNIFKLHDAMTELSVAPHLGGAIISWIRRSDRINILRPLPTQSENHPLTARDTAAFTLIPWSNRIAHHGYWGSEGWFDLPANVANFPFSMHGSVWQSNWEVLYHDQHSIKMCCELEQPVKIRVEQHIELNMGRLSITCQTTHLDERPFLHGFGWHPFFIRTKHTRIQTEFSKLWQRDELGLSVGEIELPPSLDFSQARGLPSTLIDHALSGWNGHCVIEQPDLKYALILESEMPYAMLYCPVNQPFFCLEPVSHPVNAHHMPDYPGLIELRKDDQLDWQIHLQYQWIDET